MTSALSEQRSPRTSCASCGTQLPPRVLACPACQTLVYADTLKSLAATAERQTSAGSLAEARATWLQALELLPEGTHQHSAVSKRIVDLTTRIEAAERPFGKGATSNETWWKRGAGGVLALVVLLLSKLKFLILGLTKASTFFSMFAFFGIYWRLYGWPLALGLVVSIYIHEMGHVAMLRRLGIDAGAPLFIPGVGALVLLKKHIADPIVDARIGLAGPVWGLGAGLVAYAVWFFTKIPVWGAIAALTGFINLFNLIPIWQLDGSRGFHALSRMQRWMVVAIIVAAFAVTSQKMLIIIGGVAVWRSFQPSAVVTGHRATLVTYGVLIATLSWLSLVHRV